jgi:hypothetical protein
MRTPVLLVAGQGDTDAVLGALLRQPGTLVVEHRFDGHIVRRTLVTLRDGELRSPPRTRWNWLTAAWPARSATTC